MKNVITILLIVILLEDTIYNLKIINNIFLAKRRKLLSVGYPICLGSQLALPAAQKSESGLPRCCSDRPAGSQ